MDEVMESLMVTSTKYSAEGHKAVLVNLARRALSAERRLRRYLRSNVLNTEYKEKLRLILVANRNEAQNSLQAAKAITGEVIDGSDR